MYKLDPHGDPVQVTFRAIALDQLNEAISDLDRGDSDGRSVVHEARRRCKKLRGLLRLVRPAFAGFARENEALRAAAALLSHLRDAEVLHHTVVDLGKWRPDAALDRIAQRLAATADGDQSAQLGEFRAALAEVHGRAQNWQLTRTGRDAVLPGLRQTYRSARQRMTAAAGHTDSAIHFHEWRKATKNHGFHLDLLKRTAPDVLPDDLKTIDTLSALLGQHHDLAVLKDAVAADPGRFGEPADLVVLAATIAGRAAELEAGAFAVGRQVFAERPRALGRRFSSYWKSVS